MVTQTAQPHQGSSAGGPVDGDRTGEPGQDDLPPRTALVEAAGPVLAALEADLVGARYATVLADHDCRVVRRWCDDARVRAALDAAGIREGPACSSPRAGSARPAGSGTRSATR